LVNGMECPEGAYFFALRFQGKDLRMEDRAGYVTLLR
jgi:hypothetical protein